MLHSLPAQDPGNLESDLQTGAKTGYVLLWLMLATTVLVSHFSLLFLQPPSHFRVGGVATFTVCLT